MDKVLVESSMVILTSNEFQQMLAKNQLSAQAIKNPQGLNWQPGQPHMVDFKAQELASITIDFAQEVSLSKLNRLILGSKFRNSLTHLRRPGQPMGTTIQYNEAIEKAAAVAQKQAQQQQQQQKRQQPAKPKKQYGAPMPISAEESTASPPSENTNEVPFSPQKTSESEWYGDYVKKTGNGAYTYWRIYAKSEKDLIRFAKPHLEEIRRSL